MTLIPSQSTETIGRSHKLLCSSGSVISPKKPPKLGHTPLRLDLDPVDISISVTCACNCLRSLRQQTTNYEELKAEADVSDQFQLNPHNSQQTSAQTQSP
eukprot:scaffold10846_cov118-Skeletonema_marinoi.AAC.1